MIRPIDVPPGCTVRVALSGGELTLAPFKNKRDSTDGGCFFRVMDASGKLAPATGATCTSIKKGVDLRVTPAGKQRKAFTVGHVDHIAVEKPAS